MNTIGVVIGTFGDSEWDSDGQDAAESIRTCNTADKVIHYHGRDLASARNQGFSMVQTDYVIFLDADDDLDQNYCETLRNSLVDGNVLYQPQTIAWHDRSETEGEPNFIEDRGMSMSNSLVIGTALKSEFFLGFDPSLPALEDWDLFLRMIKNGAKIKQVPGMIYKVGINDDSRNSPTGEHNKAYATIRRRGIQVKDYMI